MARWCNALWAKQKKESGKFTLLSFHFNDFPWPVDNHTFFANQKPRQNSIPCKIAPCWRMRSIKSHIKPNQAAAFHVFLLDYCLSWFVFRFRSQCHSKYTRPAVQSPLQNGTRFMLCSRLQNAPFLYDMCVLSGKQSQARVICAMEMILWLQLLLSQQFTVRSI